MVVPASPEVAPAITGSRVLLRPIYGFDFQEIYAWAPDLLRFNLLGWLRSTPTLAQFSERFRQHLREASALLVVDRTSDQPCGLVLAHDVNLIDGWCFVLTYMSRESREHALGREASFLFWDHLFRSFRLRKIYMDVEGSNRAWLDATPAVEAGLFAEEGCFRQHVKSGGSYYDVARLALTRDRWLQMREFMLLLVGVQPPPGPGSNDASRLEEGTLPQTFDVTDIVSSGTGALVDLATTFLEHVDRGSTDKMLAMLARTPVFQSPITGTIVGRSFFRRLLRDRQAMALRLGRDGAGSDRIAWSGLRAQTETTVRMEGSSASGQRIVVEWTFDDDRNISAWSWHGTPAVLASYYLSPVSFSGARADRDSV